MNKIMRYFFTAWVLLTIFSFHDIWAGNHSNKSWIVSQNIENSLEDIKLETLISVLKSLGINADAKSPRDYLEQYEILKGKYFTIYLAPIYYNKDHIWILSNTPTFVSFENLDIAQLQELEKFRYLVGETYQRHMGYQGYAAFIDFKKDYGLGQPVVCLEMMPAMLKGSKQDEFDIREKIGRNSHILFGDTDLEQLPPQKAASTINHFKTIIRKLQAENHTLEEKKRVVQNTLPWKQNLTHYDALETLSLQGFEKALLDRHSLFFAEHRSYHQKSQEIAAISDGGEFTGVKNKVNEIKKCAFCNPEVIKNQFVYKLGDFACIYNFRPYTLGYHFMVTPYHPIHVEDWQNFSLQDVLQIDQFAQAIVKAIKEESGRNDVLLFIQNGTAAGMTVPHGHMHILLRPTKIHFLAQVLLEISGNKRKGLTAEEMQPVKEKFRKKLEHLLSLSSASQKVHR